MEEKRCSRCGDEIFNYDDYSRDLFEKDLREIFPNRCSWWVAVAPENRCSEVGKDTHFKTLLLKLLKEGYEHDNFIVGLWLDEEMLNLWRDCIEVSPDFVIEANRIRVS